MNEKLIVFYRDRNIPFYSLDFVGVHGASKLLDQGTASVSELGGTCFRHPKPVVRRKAILFNAIAFQMSQAQDELGG